MSLLILQFYPREYHPAFLKRQRQAVAEHTGSKNVFVYDAKKVCYFLAAHKKHLPAIKAANRALAPLEASR